ncbi:unnamed protein product [Camellia sinensis]
MDTLSRAILLVTFSFSLFILSLPSTKATSTRAPAPVHSTPSNTIIHDVCSQKQLRHSDDFINYTICLQIITSDLGAASVSDYLTLGKIVLAAGIRNASSTNSYLHKLLVSNNFTVPGLRQRIKTCADSYDYIVGSFHSAQGEIATEPDTANYDLIMAAGDGLRSCEMAWKNSSGEREGVYYLTISKGNMFMSYFIAMGDAITNSLPNR